MSWILGHIRDSALCSFTAWGLGEIFAGDGLKGRVVGLVAALAGGTVQNGTMRARLDYCPDPEPYGYEVISTLAAAALAQGGEAFFRGNHDLAMGLCGGALFLQMVAYPLAGIPWMVELAALSRGIDYAAQKILGSL